MDPIPPLKPCVCHFVHPQNVSCIQAATNRNYDVAPKLPLQKIHRSSKDQSLMRYIHLLNTSKGRPTKAHISVKFVREVALVEKHGKGLLERDPRFHEFRSISQTSTENHTSSLADTESSPLNEQETSTELLQKATDDTDSCSELNQQTLSASRRHVYTTFNISKTMEKSFERTLSSLAHFYAFDAESELLKKELTSLMAEITRLSEKLRVLECDHTSQGSLEDPSSSSTNH